MVTNGMASIRTSWTTTRTSTAHWDAEPSLLMGACDAWNP
jgi:hypothetical protein